MTGAPTPDDAGPRWRDEDGSAVAMAGAALVVTVMIAVAVVDVTAYLLAASRAQAAADAAALAAVRATRPGVGNTAGPRAAAARVVRAAGAELRVCDCRRGRERVRVTVAVPVDALVATRRAAREVVAEARARLVRPP